MRHLALDVGDERIGVAVSDEGGRLARPLGVLARQPGPGSYLRLAALVAEYGVGRIVVGLPLLPGGEEGEQARSTRAYVAGLKQHVNIPIVLYDERGSTREAHERLRQGRGGRVTRRARRRRLDAAAAAVILQQYLDEQTGGAAW